MAKITVLTTDINVVSINNEDYICITDMLKAKDGDFFISDWLRNRNTLEYLGIWERLYNPGFNYGEFATIRNQSGVEQFQNQRERIRGEDPCYRYSSESRKIWRHLCTQGHRI